MVWLPESGSCPLAPPPRPFRVDTCTYVRSRVASLQPPVPPYLSCGWLHPDPLPIIIIKFPSASFSSHLLHVRLCAVTCKFKACFCCRSIPLCDDCQNQLRKSWPPPSSMNDYAPCRQPKQREINLFPVYVPWIRNNTNVVGRYIAYTCKQEAWPARATSCTIHIPHGSMNRGAYGCRPNLQTWFDSRCKLLP